MRNFNSQYGIGLLELMLAIIIITAVILGATKYYLVAKEAMKITQAQDIVNNVANAAYKWVEGKADFADLGTTIQPLVEAKLLPATYIGNKISPWGGSLIITTSDPPDTTHLRMGFTGITTKAKGILQNKYGVCPSTGEFPTLCVDSNGTFFFRSP